MVDGDNVVQFAPGPPGHHRVAGTDLEIVFDRRGNDLVLRVNKGGASIFRALLRDACKNMPSDELVRFSPLVLDIVTKIGDLDEGVRRLAAASVPR